jgi:AraC-like DNA-binding protein
MVLLDPPQYLLLSRDPRFVFFRVACSQLGIAPAELRHLSRVRVDAGGGIPGLIAGFLDTLTNESDLRDSAAGRRLALNAVDLIALLVADLLEPHRTAASDLGNDLMVRIRSHIEENLMDPDLSPDSIAHHISLRYLHKLFHSGGTTVGTYVRQRRLAACRLDLGRSWNRRRTVAAVAQTWGFANPSHFSRLFRQTYGLSPSEWQASASGAHQDGESPRAL